MGEQQCVTEAEGIFAYDEKKYPQLKPFLEKNVFYLETEGENAGYYINVKLSSFSRKRSRQIAFLCIYFPNTEYFQKKYPGKTFEDLQVHHKNGNKVNDDPDNLNPCTSEEHEAKTGYTITRKGNTTIKELDPKIAKDPNNKLPIAKICVN